MLADKPREIISAFMHYRYKLGLLVNKLLEKHLQDTLFMQTQEFERAMFSSRYFDNLHH